MVTHKKIWKPNDMDKVGWGLLDKGRYTHNFCALPLVFQAGSTLLACTTIYVHQGGKGVGRKGGWGGDTAKKTQCVHWQHKA